MPYRSRYPIEARYNSDIEHQCAYLRHIIGHTEFLWEILSRGEEIDLPNWYLGAGGLTQAVWNWLSGFSPGEHIRNVDLAYFDATDLSEGSEKRWEEKIQKLFKSMPVTFDVRNQARVHLWYEKKFGYPIKPHRSIEDAINTWPTTATSIGIRFNREGSRIHAPFGLNDLFGIIARPNKTQITKEIYESKVNRWRNCWPRLVIIPWDDPLR